MRKIALFSILALLICSWFLFRDTEIVQASLSKINSKFDNITKQREVRFEGLSILDESDFAALVPFDRSIAWLA